jgi:hypothetical protein
LLGRKFVAHGETLETRAALAYPDLVVELDLPASSPSPACGRGFKIKR